MLEPVVASSAGDALEADRSEVGHPTLRSRLIVGLVIVAIYLPAVAAIGLRTDLGGHLIYAEKIGLTGRSYGPYYLYEQVTVVVRGMIPFSLIGRVFPAASTRQATWDIAGVIALLGFVALTVDLVHRRLRSAASRWPARQAAVASAVLAVVAMVAAPLTMFTWGNQQLLSGYINITTYDSATTGLLKPLALLFFWWIVDRIHDEGSRPATIAATVGLSVLVLHAKPSFTVAFLPVMVLYVLWMAARRSAFNRRLLIGGFILPSTAYLLLQASEFPQGGTVGLAPFRAIRTTLALYGQDAWMAAPLLVASVAFPIAVVVVHRRTWSTSVHLVLAWACFVVGVGLYYLVGVNDRVDYGELLASAQVPLFILYVESIRFAVASSSSATADGRGRGHWSLAVILALQVVCGAVLWYHETFNPGEWW